MPGNEKIFAANFCLFLAVLKTIENKKLMSKKKAAKKQASLSPENYIRQKARNLPMAECFVTPDWKEAGECNILVARRHTNGNYTLGFYLIDTYCLGVKDAGYRFNISESEYYELKENFGGNLEPVTYNEAHNIVYGALAYAEDLGFSPHKDFGVAQYILEEDTEDIPLIEYEFGRNDKPFLVVNTRAELNRYLPTLKKAVGNDYDFLVHEGEEDYREEEEHDETMERAARQLLENFTDEERENFLKSMSEMTEHIEKSESLPRTTYNYQYPDYPQELNLSHSELEALFLPANNDKLDKKTLDTILSLPRETLIKDLENCILYELGQNCLEISENNNDENIYGSVAHALHLLAELKHEKSLSIVLEVMRQNEKFYEFFFGDYSYDILVPVLYQLGRNQLSALLAYMKEPNLNIFFKASVSPCL